jgi:murein DD-endopeptidase MepM/ murein hydrolase activator NlpD
MFRNRHRSSSGGWRALPLRNEQLLSNQEPPTYTLALAAPTGASVWFTPEVVIWDALGVLEDLLWLWQRFRQLVSIFALRVLLIAALIFVVSGLNQTSDEASVFAQNPVEQPTNPVQISTQIKAVTNNTAPAMVWPVSTGRITTGFSGWHRGIDMPRPYGTPVNPFSAGRVTFAGWDGGFGYTVLVDHGNGLSSRYAHLSAVSVRPGDPVSTISTIGAVGSTGYAFGSHLHLEIYRDGIAVNPLLYLR